VCCWRAEVQGAQPHRKAWREMQAQYKRCMAAPVHGSVASASSGRTKPPLERQGGGGGRRCPPPPARPTP